MQVVTEDVILNDHTFFYVTLKSIFVETLVCIPDTEMVSHLDVSSYDTVNYASE